MEKDIEFIKESQQKLDKKFDDFIIDVDNRYASKYVEKVFWWLMASIGTIIITSLMYLVLNVP